MKNVDKWQEREKKKDTREKKHEEIENIEKNGNNHRERKYEQERRVR